FASGETGVLRCLVECSSGTYVRVLAADLGERLGGVAHLRALRRLRVGSFTDGEAVALDAFDSRSLFSCLELVRDLPRIEVCEALREALRHGRSVERSTAGAAGEGPWAVTEEDGGLLAVLEAKGSERIHPSVVLAPAH
ncbi:MAG: hypothetical protein ACRDZ5_10065, partial [Acidimicrobiales bacterium]